MVEMAQRESPDLYRLVYFSRNRIAGSAAGIATEIDDILTAARRSNPLLGLTGALVFNSGIFAQVLEGPQQGIEALFEKIQRDPRHGDVHILAFEKVAQRQFPSWSMAFIGRSREGEDLFGHLGDATGFEAKRLESERVLTLMKSIALEEEAIAPGETRSLASGG